VLSARGDLLVHGVNRRLAQARVPRQRQEPGGCRIRTEVRLDNLREGQSRLFAPRERIVRLEVDGDRGSTPGPAAQYAHQGRTPGPAPDAAFSGSRRTQNR
jgi:hypothetical protein